MQLKPNALDLITKSKEFRRTSDNTVYHKGFPTCFRSPGTPSIQVSLTSDGSRADIDVDYRSSGFPKALVNGHLTASNSDIRAGNNDERHNGQWSGMQNWWRSLLGLPLTNPSAKPESKGLLAPDPKKKGIAPSDSIRDFLDNWLVKQSPEESVPYLSERAFACMEVESKSKVDRGMAKYRMLQAMQAFNRRTGKRATLRDASEAVTFDSDRLKPIDHPNKSEFALYDVREDLAEEFDCAGKRDPASVNRKALRSKAFGKYLGAIFRVKEPKGRGSVIATLWEKERGYWKAIAYDVDPEVGKSASPNTGAAAVAVRPLEAIEGDKEMIRASTDFLTDWLVTKKIDRAMTYVAPECLPCVNLYRDDETPAATTAVAQKQLLRRGLAVPAASVGVVKTLAEAATAPEAHHPALKMVNHANSDAFLIVGIPDNMAEGADCRQRKRGEEPSLLTGGSGYGKYYATGLSLNPSAVLWIVWGQSGGSWKALSYAVMTP